MKTISIPILDKEVNAEELWKWYKVTQLLRDGLQLELGHDFKLLFIFSYLSRLVTNAAKHFNQISRFVYRLQNIQDPKTSSEEELQSLT